ELLVWLAESTGPDSEQEVLYLRYGGRREPVEDAFRRAVLRDGAPLVETEAVLRGGSGTRLLARTVSAARPYSTTLSRDRALWKVAPMVARAAAAGDGEPAPQEAPAARAPSTAELLARSPWRWLRILGARALFARPWQVLVRERGEDPAAGWPPAHAIVRWQPGHAYADPFLFERDGRHHLFCEEIRPDSWRAVISHVELRADGATAGPPEPVLEAAYHLSYPFLFAHAGEVFMIPETSSQQRVELYRAVSFPREWRREAVLLEGIAASDATLLEHDGRLWLFVNVAAPGATLLDELHLFSATEPRGPWEAHAGNPVVSDVRAGRPAGAVQRWGDRLVRPAQDSSLRYGGAISFRQIDELTVERYAEHEIGRIEPGDVGGRATHTYASDGRFEAVDLRRRRLRPRAAPRRAAGRDRG
ncbi:MAG: hypothetical protein QOK19_2328, partial [Solirubrobacteraceae bacterium]|nr:hypothetical protein [Solirubrobacteraceae bacterium]